MKGRTTTPTCCPEHCTAGVGGLGGNQHCRDHCEPGRSASPAGGCVMCGKQPSYDSLCEQHWDEVEGRGTTQPGRSNVPATVGQLAAAEGRGPTHRWAYSNTNEAWFCEVCHRQDRSGEDVPDDERCPGKKEPR